MLQARNTLEANFISEESNSMPAGNTRRRVGCLYEYTAQQTFDDFHAPAVGKSLLSRAHVLQVHDALTQSSLRSQ